jgi:molecular chaperone DnaJ
MEVPTLDGQRAHHHSCRVPSQAKFSACKTKDCRYFNVMKSGDMLVHVNVWTPKKLNDEEQKMLEKMRTMHNFQPTPGQR